MKFWFDLKYAGRLLFKTPGHSLLCVVVVALSVGLGIWACEAVYSTEFKPLPFPGSDSWYSVQIGAKAATSPEPEVDEYTYQEILKRTRGLDFLAYTSRPAVLSEGQASTSLRAAAISPALLSAMRSAPLMGRLFDAADSEAGAVPTVILSYAAWQGYFAADPSIVGKQARVDGQSMRIVGVMPQPFYAFQDFELWFPLHLQTLVKPGDSTVTLSPFVILDHGQDPDAVANEMKPALDEVNANYPKIFNSGRHVALFPAHLMLTHDQLPFIAMISFIAIAVLLLGCVNIGMLFFARLLERSRELALRVALGSSRWRLLRQCLLESVFVVGLGLLLGIGLAALGIRWGQNISDVTTPILATGRPSDYPAIRAVDLLVAVLAAVVIWLLSTLVPAWRISRQDAAVVLAGTGKSVGSSGNAKSVIILVGFQVILSCLVLVICANLMFAVNSEASKPTGIRTSQIMLSTYLTAFDARYPDAATRVRYWDDLTASIKGRLPGAEVAFTTSVPTRPTTVPASIEHKEGASDQGTFKLPVSVVSENYFDLVGLQKRAGRLFDATDNGTSLDVAVVDENTARRYWPDQDVLGKRIQLNPTDNGPWLTIVGVVSAVAGEPYGETVGVVYQSLRQAAPAGFQLLVKLPNAAADSRTQLRAAAYAVDRDLPLHNLQMLDDYLGALDIAYKSIVPLFSVIAGITVILAATGLFGLISRSVAQRTQEVGVRRALGGTRWQVTAVFLRQAAIYLGIGLVGGVVGIVVTNLLSASIPNILTLVAPVTVGVFFLMALVIFVSSYLPTRRAVALEPGDALRYE